MRRVIRSLFARPTFRSFDRPAKQRLQKMNRRNLAVTSLEDRCTPAVFIVNSIGDDTTGMGGVGGMGDLRYCIAQANLDALTPDTIQFDTSVGGAFETAKTILLGAPLVVTSPVDIQGAAGKVTVDGQNTVNVLFINPATATDSITVTDITVTKGKTVGVGVGGAGIGISLGFVTLTNVNVTNCTSEDDGGGILIIGGELVATNVIISGNTTTGISGVTLGAGISIEGTAKATLSKCTIINNNLLLGVGGTQSNGAAIADLTSSDVLIDQCLIANNLARDFSGALYITAGGTTKVTNSIFRSNSVNTGAGGAVLISTSGTTNAIFEDTQFIGNSAPNAGGAIVAFGATGAATPTTTISFTRCTALNNSSAGGSGGFYTNYSGVFVSLSFVDCTISGNTAQVGGAIYCVNRPGGVNAPNTTPVTISRSTFANNQATVGSGGTISLQDYTGNALIEDSTFLNNSAVLSAGAIFTFATVSSNGGILTVNNTSFFGNVAGGIGAAFRPSGGANNGVQTTFNNCTIVGNESKTAGGAGGVAVNTGGAGGFNNFVNCIIAGNTTNGVPTGNDGVDLARTSTAPMTLTNNMIGVLNPGLVFTNGGGNLTGTSATPLIPPLRPLTNYGGVTKTRAPIAGPAPNPVNSGNASVLGFLTNDQRGAGFPRNDGGLVDIGAVESNVPRPWVTMLTASNVSKVSDPSTFTITFDGLENINLASLSTAGAVQLQRVGTFDAPIDAVLDGTPVGTNPVTAKFKFTPPGGTWDAGDNGTYKIYVRNNKITDSGGDAVPGDEYGSFSVGVPLLITVNATNDETSDTDGKVSLREALILANSSAGLDTIQFDAAVFNALTTINTSALGTLPITDSVKIVGPAFRVTIDVGTSGNGVLSINGPGVISADISSLTLINGQKIGAFSGYEGAGIVIGDENVTLTDCTLLSNSAELRGGGIFVAGGNLTVNNCVFDSNKTVPVTAPTGSVGQVNPGGAIAFSGAGNLVITNSQFVNNEGAGGGGAIFATGATNVTVSGSSFTGNKGTGVGISGGAVWLVGVTTASFTNCQFTNNELLSTGNGGAFFIDGGPNLSITDCTFDGNKTADGFGGAIATNATATGTINIATSTFKNNNAQGGLGRGGAISIGGNTAVTISRSTLNANSSAAGGGAVIYENGTTALLLIQNSTFSGNSAFGGDGGGLLVNNLTAPVTVLNSTFTLNSAGLSGGGIQATQYTGTFKLSSTIVADNTAAFTTFNDIGSDTPITITANENLTGAIDPSITLMGAGNDTTTNALLNPLADNGGPTQTHLPQLASPAIGSGTANGLLVDQRGSPRTIGANTDVGAVERAVTAPTVSMVTINDGSAQRSMVTSIKVTFDQAVTITNVANAFKVERYGSLVTPPGAVGLIITGSGATYTLTFTNGAISIDPAGSLADGQYHITVVAAEVSGDAGTMAANSVTNTWRLFGDGNGDGAVTAADFNDFRLFYGSVGNPLAAKYDYNGDGTITAADFNTFRTRYGMSGFNIP